MPDEYDHSYDNQASFEAAEADTAETLQDPMELWDEVREAYGLEDNISLDAKRGWIHVYQEKNTWWAAQALCGHPKIDEAIKALLEDPTNDNAVGLVLTIREFA